MRPLRLAILTATISIASFCFASETKGTIVSFSLSGTGNQTVFLFRLSSTNAQGQPECDTTGQYAIHMNVKNAVFAASVIANAQNESFVKEPLSVDVVGTGSCNNRVSAEDARVLTITEGGKTIAVYRVEQTKANELPIDGGYPLPPIIRNVRIPTTSPAIEDLVEGFFHDYCYAAADTPSKWYTNRSQDIFAAKLLMLKIPFVTYVANGSMGSVCFLGGLFGRKFYDEQSRQTYTERIVGRSATVLWRNDNMGGIGGAVFYKENDHWKIDFVYNFTLPGGAPAYGG